MTIQTRLITVNLFDTDGTPLENARVVVTLVGLGNEPGGAVAPGSTEQFTDANGQTVFELWENNGAYSNTYYEVQSWHPTKATAIHRREKFRVPDYNADLEELIALALANVNPNQELLDQVSAAKDSAIASAESSSSSAQSSAASALASSNSATASANNAASASASAAAALSSEQLASNASDAAGISADSAAQAAVAANNSAIAASGHKDAAAASALLAQDSASAAAISESNAETSASNAATSASSSSGSAAAAAASEVNAENYSVSAAASAAAANSSATAAATSESGAAASASSAATSEANAQSSADDAAASALAASQTSLSTVLAGLTFSDPSGLVDGDTLLQALEKLQAKANLAGIGEKLPLLTGIDLNDHITPGERFLIYATTSWGGSPYVNHPMEAFTQINKNNGQNVIEVSNYACNNYIVTKATYTLVVQVAQQVGCAPLVRYYTADGVFSSWQYFAHSLDYNYNQRTVRTLNAGTLVTSGSVTYWSQGPSNYYTGELVLGALNGSETITFAEGNLPYNTSQVAVIPLCLASPGNNCNPRLVINGDGTHKVVTDSEATPGTYYFSHRMVYH